MARTSHHQRLNTNYRSGQYDAIESFACKYTSIDNPTRINQVVTNQAIIDSLYDCLIDHSHIVQLSKFLAELSEHKPEAVSAQSTIDELVVKPFAAGGSEMERIEGAMERMILVSSKAGHYAATNENGPALVKLKLMLSYIMLHLTLEQGIRRHMIAQDELIPEKTIDGKKLGVLQKRLADNGVVISAGKLREYVRYGKTLLDMITKLGIIALPMMAIGGPAITTLCKKNGPTTKHFPVLGSRLSTNVSWMAICKTWSSIFIEIVFTNSQQKYSKEELFNSLIAELLGRFTTASLHKHYLHGANRIPPIRYINRHPAIVAPALEPAANLFTLLGITIPLFPEDKYPNTAIRNIKLVRWLLKQNDNAKLTLQTDPYHDGERIISVPVATFRELLDPGVISNKLVGFLGAMWNQQALPGWAMISPKESRKVLHAELGGDPLMAITIALGGRRYNMPYENVLLPIMFDNLLFPLHVSMREKVATFYLLQNSGHHVAQALKEIEVSIKIKTC